MADGASVRIALIGFGEAGEAFARGLVGRAQRVSAFDARFAAPQSSALREQAEKLGVAVCDSARAAAKAADVVVSAVTAAAALDVAREAVGYIGPRQFFLDINSVGPETKQQAAALIDGAGGRYVEAAVMAPVPRHGLAVPMLIGGRWAQAAKALLEPCGMVMDVAGDQVGLASAIKMCRSIMTKGIEALAVECMLTARHYGVEAQVIASMNETYPGVDWRQRMAYLMQRVMLHGRRRAEEVRETAETVRAAGLEPILTAAVADRQDWVGRLNLAEAAGGGDKGDPAALADAIRSAARR